MTRNHPRSGTLPLVCLSTLPVFPGAAAQVDLARGTTAANAVRRASLHGNKKGSNLVVIGIRRTDERSPVTLDTLHPVGLLAEVLQLHAGIPGRLAVMVRGLCRVNLLDLLDEHNYQVAQFSSCAEDLGELTLSYALSGALQDLIKRHDSLLPSASRTKARSQALAGIQALRRPSHVADMVAAHIELEPDDRTGLLVETTITARLRRVIELVSHRVNVLQVKRDLDRYVRDHLSKHEQEALLRHKLRAIQSELGETPKARERNDFDDLSSRLDSADLPDHARAAADRDLGRLRRMNPQSSEATTTRIYLEWLADLPWSYTTASEDKLDLDAARGLLEDQHYGLEKVKKRILEYLSVRKLAPEKRGPILCLVGPPGVGKTSLGRSIADALGRSYVRISLGGVQDDAEIRGHRRTYVGALPGRLIQAMKRAGTINPVVVLDEIDKLGGPNLRGDPASALLEALDPEQNNAFSDHYLNIDYDLSNVVFLTTANDLGGIPHVLRDRLEIIRLSGYTIEEKVAIARGYLLPKQTLEHGLNPERIEIHDNVFVHLATAYTRESGVRNLERKLASLLRHLAIGIAEGKASSFNVTESDLEAILGPRRYHPQLAEKVPTAGVVTGLGWTATGGTLLFVEATLTRGSGKLRMTGRLGDVMKESAQAALSLVRSRAQHHGIDPAFMATHDVHIHFPAGAVPKDGPSAGIAVTTALISALTQRPVRVDIAMTGEITLKGHVLPIGGVREKALAAHRAGLREVILPERNRKDEPHIPARAREDLKLHYVRTIDEVLGLALTALPDESAAAE